jgi:diguanylate cyclase (GGDEF)-like protein
MSISAFGISIYGAIVLFHLTLIYSSIRARKNVQSASAFAFLALWVFVSVGGLIAGKVILSQPRPSTTIWQYFSFGGTILAAPALLIFIINHLRVQLRYRLLIPFLMYLPAGILIPLLATNNYHQLFWNRSGGVYQPDSFGSLHQASILICAGFAVTALILLVERFPKIERIYHVQYGLFLAGILFPIAVTIFDVIYNPPVVEILNYAIAAWSLMMLLSAFALLRLPMYGLLPIAQSELLRHIRDGFLITNSHQEVIFINPAAQRSLKVTEREAFGEPLSGLISASTKKIIINTEMKHTSFELQIDDSYYHVNISNIRSKRQHIIGQIVMIYDVTAQTEFSNQFREQANKDELTQVYNRRYLLDHGEMEFKRARRYQLPFSIILLDMDGLKRINDQFGHMFGDRAIHTFSRTCQQALRASDTIGRFGGDEFVVLLPHTDAEGAKKITERLAATLEQTSLETGNGPFYMSASFGITSLDAENDVSLETMLKRADQALYLAKSNPDQCYQEVQSAVPQD